MLVKEDNILDYVILSILLQELKETEILTCFLKLHKFDLWEIAERAEG